MRWGFVWVFSCLVSLNLFLRRVVENSVSLLLECGDMILLLKLLPGVFFFFFFL